MHSLLVGIRRANTLGSYALAEPFAGGAGASLSLLFLEETPQITINDADRSVFDFWWVLLNQYEEFASAVRSVRISMNEWRRQRAIYLSPRSTRFQRAFATFFLNRCNRSGIVMNGGPIGGIRQEGKWSLAARFNKTTLLQRCSRVSEYRERIRTSGKDGRTFLEGAKSTKTMFFVDPPYYHKGVSLYLNSLTHDYHEALAVLLRDLSDNPWVLTYDDCPEVRAFYKGWANIRRFTLRYTAREQRSGAELLITPKWLSLPSKQLSEAITW